MNNVDTLPDGTPYGWGHVLDYIGVKWRDPQDQFGDELEQLTWF